MEPMRRFVYYGASSAGATLLLDLYPATAAYSLRKLRTDYTGAAIRVRRSLDNDEQDIGFVGSVLDTVSLLSFVGSGNGFVTNWYDQQGSRNLIQGSSSAQPQIVASGVTIVRGGLPAVKFDGSNDRILTFGDSFLNVANVSFFSVSNNDTSGGRGIIHSQSTSTATIRTFCDRTSTASNMIINNSLNIAFRVNLSIIRDSINQRLLSSFVDSSFNMSAFDNGALGTTNTYTGAISNAGLQLGCQGTGITFLNGTIQEFIGYNTHEILNRTAIETNINSHYGIY